jgi:Phosphodiester glycosidase
MTERSTLRRRTLATLVAAATALSPAILSGFGPLSVSAHAAAPVVHRYSLGSKVKLVTYAYATGPQQVRVITITQGSASLNVVPADSKFGLEVKPSTIASSGYLKGDTTYAPGIAATNGGFAKNKMPFHMEEIDGQVNTSGIQSTPQFGVTADGSRAFIGHPAFTTTGVSGGTNFSVSGWNARAPRPGKIGAYTPVGGSVPDAMPPSGTSPKYCAVRLVPSAAGPAWSDLAKSGIARPYTVTVARTCASAAMAFGTNPEAVVLAAAEGTSGDTKLTKLGLGASVTLTTQHAGWPGVVNVIGGTPVLVDAGVNVGPGYTTSDPSVYKAQPRTAIAINAGCADTDPTTICKIFLVTVDGRQSTWSKGWLMSELGNFLVKKLHARYALNLDGGGGTVAWIHKNASTHTPPCIKSAAKGCLVDKPADRHGERAAIMALVPVRGPYDLGIPTALR